METPLSFLPVDRCHALARGEPLAERMTGAVLFVDISGFTALSEAITRRLGPRRGAEEITRQIDRVYDLLIATVDLFGGSVVSFAGDAISCWFAADDGLVATTCALEMQRLMVLFREMQVLGSDPISLTMKALVSVGPVRRLLVGSPALQRFDLLAGRAVTLLGPLEELAQPGEVLLESGAAERLADRLLVRDARRSPDGSREAVAAVVVADVLLQVAPRPWPVVDAAAVPVEQVRQCLPPAVADRLWPRGGLPGEAPIAELRPVVSLFLRFTGLDYDADQQAEHRLDAFIRWVQSVLVHYAGSLIDVNIGDKGNYLTALFGAPIAHEDDIRRALSAALELRMPPPTLQGIEEVQIGVTQGVAWVGIFGGSTRRTYGMMGAAVNLAARLMQTAGPGQVLATEQVRQAAGAGFRWQRLAPVPLKGAKEATTVVALLGRREQSLSPQPAGEEPVALVGRSAELALIDRLLDGVAAGQGQGLVLSGEAGIGKSQLAAAALLRAVRRDLALYSGESVSYGIHTPYLAWRPIVQRLLGIDPAWPAAQQVQAAEAHLLGLDPLLATRLPLLSLPLQLPIPDNDVTSALDPRLRKESLEALLVECLRAAALRKPLLLVLEDCHWLDWLSVELLERVARVIDGLPVFMLLTLRATETASANLAPLLALPYINELQLGALSPAESCTLLAEKLARLSPGAARFSPALLQAVAERAQGNPFYLAELASYIRESGIDLRDRHALEGIELPENIQRLVLSRVDQLPDHEQRTLKVASVLGPSFPARWLWCSYPALGDSAAVLSSLEALCRDDLLALERSAPEPRYLFRHVLTHEATYQSMPFTVRAVLHEQLARYLEAELSAEAARSIDLLAYHYERSANLAKKREYLRRAASSAQAAYANSTALDYYARLLPLLEEPAEIIEVLLQRGAIRQLTGHWAEAETSYREALERTQSLAGSQHSYLSARCWQALGRLCSARGEYAAATEWLQRALEEWQRHGAESGAAETLAELGAVAERLGDYSIARQRLNQSLALARRLANRPAIASALNTLGNVAIRQGAYDEAQSLLRESLLLAYELGDKRRISNTLGNLANLALSQGRFDEAQALLEPCLELKRMLGDSEGIGGAFGNLGVIAHLKGDYQRARELYLESLEVARELGDKSGISIQLNNLGELAALDGDYAEARRLYGSSLELYRALGDRWGISGSLGNLGLVAIGEGDYATAQPLLRECLLLSREIGEWHALFRALVGLARLALQDAAGYEPAQRAVWLISGVEALLGAQGAPLEPDTRALADEILALAAGRLSDPAFDQMRDEGRRLALEQLVGLAVDDQPADEVIRSASGTAGSSADHSASG